MTEIQFSHCSINHTSLIAKSIRIPFIREDRLPGSLRKECAALIRKESEEVILWEGKLMLEEYAPLSKTPSSSPAAAPLWHLS